MIKVTKINGVQTITEVCDTCKCYIQNLTVNLKIFQSTEKNVTVNDIIVKPPSLSGVTLTDSDGKEVTRTEPRSKCYCEHCNH